ncbi:MAG: type IV pilus twitching motility protein PilT [Clostridiaceae bacterium]
MKKIEELFVFAIELKASDIHLSVGSPPVFRINGELKFMAMNNLTPEATTHLVKEVLTESSYEEYISEGEYDCAYEVPGVGRFRANIFKKMGNDALVLRTISANVPSLESLEMPEVIKNLTKKTRGLILVTGVTGSGKSTTLAAMINEINASRSNHILTLEDPVEYLHKNNKSIVSQREIGKDSKNYANALRAALREDPDVILVGEMRDLETISIAMSAAETGHLVLSTLHTLGAVKTIDRIIGEFPSHQQTQVRTQLSSIIEGVISQQLIPSTSGGRVAALEVMISTDAIRNQIREGKSHQLESSLQMGSKDGMITMDNSILNLLSSGKITRETALSSIVNKENASRIN